VKKNQQLAQLLLEIHEQWARANGYRDKQQASSAKLGEPQATSVKRQAQRVKRQATSVKLSDH
jgi:hypothetical protein